MLKKIHKQNLVEKETDIVLFPEFHKPANLPRSNNTKVIAPDVHQTTPEAEESFLGSFQNIPEGQRFLLEAKVNRILSNKKYITPAPGDDDMTFLVASESGKSVFHHVTVVARTGQITCDPKKCLPYKVGKVCQHALALASSKHILASYALWHNNQKGGLDPDKIMSFNLSKETGLKKHLKTQRRLGTTLKNPQTTSIRNTQGTRIHLRSQQQFRRYS